MEKKIFAVDIGGSKLIAAALTPTGEILESVRTDYAPGYTPDMLTALIRQGFDALKHHSFYACGATIPGLADPDRGLWLYSPFSGISDLPIGAMLEAITGLPAYVDNDVNLSALAEKQFGATRDVDDFLWVTVSNGIGGGLFLGGKLYRGSRMTAGEIGHVVVEENDGRLCGCGQHGCLEAMASGASIAAIYKDRSGVARSAKELAERARTGDAEALRVYREAGCYVGKAVAHAVNLLGLETVVLGGGVSQAFDLLEPAALEGLDAFVFKGAVPRVRLLPSALDANAALLGCAARVNEALGTKKIP